MLARQPIEQLLADLLHAKIGVRPQTEYQFCTERKWRWDCCYPDQRLAIEIDGSRHLSHKQRRRDCEKRNAALEMSWKVLSYPADVILAKCRQPLIVDQVHRVLSGVCDSASATSVLTG